MANVQNLIDLDGLSYFLGQIKAKFVRSVNGVKPDSKGNVNIANMEGATSNVAGKAGLVPIPAAGKQDMALCGDATYKVLPIAGGGTGQTTVAGVRYALGLGNTDGALPIANGGTGADNAPAALSNLGVDTTSFNPTGTIIAFAGNTLPDGYLLCDGSKVSRTTYKKLFDVIGTTYGEGDGSTTFTLPNLIDRFLEGSSAAGIYREAALPNIEGRIFNNYNSNNSSKLNSSFGELGEKDTLNEGALYIGDFVKRYAIQESISEVYSYAESVNFDASRSNAIYGKASTVQPSSCTVKMLIKY